MIYLVAIPFTQVFPASWFGHITSPNCWWNSSWDFYKCRNSVTGQWKLFPRQVGLDGTRDRQEVQSKPGDITHLLCQKLTHFWVFMIFFSPFPGRNFFFSTPKKELYCINTWFHQPAYKHHKREAFCWLPAGWSKLHAAHFGHSRIGPVCQGKAEDSLNLDQQDGLVTYNF